MSINTATAIRRTIRFSEAAAALGLERTAARARLTKPDAPIPIRISRRVVRWYEDEMVEFVASLQAPATIELRNTVTGLTGQRPPARRGGRPRRSV